MISIAEIDEKLGQVLSEKRYTHSVYVAHTASDLAERFGYDRNKAFIAGLIHDCAKYMTYDVMLQTAKQYGYTLDETTLHCPGVIHADIGALVEEHEYGISDTEILDAIRYHTVARKGMTLLDKIIYLADIIEPNRDFDGVDVLRELSKKDLDKAFFEALKFSLGYNLKKETIIHPATLDAWNDVLINTREEQI